MKNPKKHSEVAQVGRFGLVGILNTIVDFAVLNILVITLLPKDSVIFTLNISGLTIVITGLILAGLISGTCAMINSFIFNRSFTFKVMTIDRLHIFYFFLVTIFGLYVIRPIVLYVFTDVWLWPSQISYSITSALNLPLSQDFDERNVALLAAIVVVLVYNYCMYKYFVFKK